VNEPFGMYAGEVKALLFTIYDLDADPTGATPLDLTGYTARWSLTRAPGSGYVEESSLFKDMTVVDAPNGVVQVDLVEADTVDIEGNFRQQVRIFLTSASDAPSVVFAGPFLIRRTQSDE
jgi:hypothetical protein